MECINNIIGITRMPCDCIIDELPDGYAESKSGLYLDELPQFPIDLNSIKRLDECGKDFATILTNAPITAASEFRKSLFKLLQTTHRSNVKPFNGLVAAMAYNQLMNLTSTFAGVVFKTEPIRSGVLQIDRVLTSFNTSKAELPVKIYSNGIEIGVMMLSTQAGGIKENVLTAPVILPMSDSWGNSITYSFLYEREGMQPRDHLVSCNCGEKEREMKKYITASGIIGNNPVNVLDFEKTKYTNGLLINIDVRCNADESICKAYNENEFIKVAVQDVILKKAVELLIVGMLNSKHINRDTMANREQMQHNAWNLAKKFNNDMQWIAENIDLSSSDCYTCNVQNNPYRKSGILS